ncbi:B- and T-lymphocyte attenuator isoform X1 [Struthio camelus]|uniref:B- and T-lymphocyte attenuator isoform X1 n=1 Tax=Struthio camelus TaxID=8801 RepID=UPI00051E637B|nr:PREDICTED: B- and T-lymphocyte attenuator isoform X1 [Struthio camelus australis]
MKGPPVMFIKRILLHILLVMLAQSNYQVYGFDATDCPVEIQVKRNSQYKSYLGNSLVIYCPVHYCQERPAVQWCKIEGNECMLLKESKAEWKANNKFILEFFSVHHNDSGTYRCRATAGTLSSESHGIRVIVEEKPANIITSSSENTTSISEDSQESGNDKIFHFIYAALCLRLCCPLVFTCMFWCLRWYHAKQKRTPLTPQRRETLVRGPAAIPYCAAGTTQASDESSSLYYCSMVSPWQLSDSSAIYDNDVPHCDAHRTAPKAPHCDPAIPSISAAPESQDVLIYAALNHSASAEKCQRREPRVENELTEYASITVKNKPSQDFSSHPLCRQSQV